MKKKIAAVSLGLMLLMGTAMAAQPAEPDTPDVDSAMMVTPGMTTLPNPMVPYKNYAALAEQVDFKPLMMPKGSGYELVNLFAIDDVVADLRYEKDIETDKRAEVMVRTIEYKKRMRLCTPEEMSGLNGYQWKTKKINNTKLKIAEDGYGGFGAAWRSKDGKYGFAVFAQNISQQEFYDLLTGYLVDITEHYYNN